MRKRDQKAIALFRQATRLWLEIQREQTEHSQQAADLDQKRLVHAEVVAEGASLLLGEAPVVALPARKRAPRGDSPANMSPPDELTRSRACAVLTEAMSPKGTK